MPFVGCLGSSDEMILQTRDPDSRVLATGVFSTSKCVSHVKLPLAVALLKSDIGMLNLRPAAASNPVSYKGTALHDRW